MNDRDIIILKKMIQYTDEISFDCKKIGFEF